MDGPEAGHSSGSPATREPSPTRWLVAALLLLGLFWIGFARVRPTNFGGTDDWVVIDLASRGITETPYANRPLNFLWMVPAAFFVPHDLRGYWLLSGLYLSLGGLTVLAIAHRLWPRQPMLALASAAFTLVWAPRDSARLASVTATFYAGVLFGTLLALMLFLESLRGHRSAPLVLALAVVVGVATARSYEAPLPLLMGAACLLVPFRTTGLRRALLSLAIWQAAMLTALAVVLRPLLRPAQSAAYQLSSGPRPDPAAYALALAHQFGLHLLPLFGSDVRELAALPVAVAAILFAAGAVALGRGGLGGAEPPARPALGLAAGAGLLLAGLGYAAQILASTEGTREGTRMQLLSTPGIALFLACAVLLAASLIPAASGRAGVVALLGGWVVAVGTGRLLALQRQWDGASAYPAQQRCLAQLTQQAPHLQPDTLVVLLDEVGAWPAAFTFQHAVRYLYEGRARGHVWTRAEQLYAVRFVAEGVWHEPWPVIRGPWHEEPRFYRYRDLVVARYERGRLSILASWPDGILPDLPPGAVYNPAGRVDLSASLPAARRILGRP
jgi:hypothetical protein